MSDNDISTPKFSVGDHVCTDQSELSGWAPATIDEVYSDGSYRAITDSGVPFKLALDWEQYYYTCVIEEPPVDACTGVSCPNICSNGSLYMQKCVDGVCVNYALLKSPANAPECNSSGDGDVDHGDSDDNVDNGEGNEGDQSGNEGNESGNNGEEEEPVQQYESNKNMTYLILAIAAALLALLFRG